MVQAKIDERSQPRYAFFRRPADRHPVDELIGDLGQMTA